jgi:thiosulfate reductase cytochrome b subunit
MTQVYIYKRFERFWHWSQAGLIIFLAFTGFEVHDSLHFFGFEHAVRYHRAAAYMLLILTAFSIFWHLTTGEWRHYVPTLRNLRTQVRYYTHGIFHGEPHPFRKNALRKLNPLQVLTYLGFKLFLIPLTVGSGLLYMFQKWFDANDTVVVSGISLEAMAVVHTLGGYLLMAFLVVHIYMTSTGHTPLSNIRAMVTGYEEVEGDPEPQAREAQPS